MRQNTSTDMPSKKLINGLPNTLIQQYNSTTFYYIDGYMADWLWAVLVDKKKTELTIDILNKSITPADVQSVPLLAFVDQLQETIKKTLTSTGFSADFITEAKFNICLPNKEKMPKLVTIEATLKDKDDKVYKSKKYEEKSYGDASLLDSLK